MRSTSIDGQKNPLTTCWTNFLCWLKWVFPLTSLLQKVLVYKFFLVSSYLISVKMTNKVKDERYGINRLFLACMARNISHANCEGFERSLVCNPICLDPAQFDSCWDRQRENSLLSCPNPTGIDTANWQMKYKSKRPVDVDQGWKCEGPTQGQEWGKRSVIEMVRFSKRFLFAQQRLICKPILVILCSRHSCQC